MSQGVGLKVLRIVLVLALAFLTAVVLRAALTGPRTATSLPVLGQVTDFALTEQNGRTVSAATLAGHVWVADFIFTRCSSTCPRMTARMAQLAAELADRPEIRFVSFTVDPAHDSPAVLTRYAEGYRADSERWLFLTGSKEAIYRLTRESFRLGVEEVAVAGPGLPGDRPGDPSHGAEDPFIHSTRFVLVDRQGRIRGYYDGAEEARIIQLRRDVETLLREGPPA